MYSTASFQFLYNEVAAFPVCTDVDFKFWKSFKSLVTELQNEEENQSSLWCTNDPYTDVDTWNMSD